MPQTFSTATLQDFLYDSTNTPLPNVPVTITPTQNVTSTSQPTTILAKAQSVTSDGTGKWSGTVPQSFSGAAEYIVAPAGVPAFRVAIPVGAGPFTASQNKAADSA